MVVSPVAGLGTFWAKEAGCWVWPSDAMRHAPVTNTCLRPLAQAPVADDGVTKQAYVRLLVRPAGGSKVGFVLPPAVSRFQPVVLVPVGAGKSPVLAYHW